jgi:hypothetical protein
VFREAEPASNIILRVFCVSSDPRLDRGERARPPRLSELSLAMAGRRENKILVDRCQTNMESRRQMGFGRGHHGPAFLYILYD